MSKHDDSRLKCSFCGKTQDQVKKLIAGPEVYICDECVELCNEILDEEFFEGKEKGEASDSKKLPEEKPSGSFKFVSSFYSWAILWLSLFSFIKSCESFNSNC